jgi:hypothetical protein
MHYPDVSEMKKTPSGYGLMMPSRAAGPQCPAGGQFFVAFSARRDATELIVS